MKIEFHCHTTNSFDCNDSLDDKARKYIDLGFDKVYVTDHDELYTENKYDIFASGIEVSTTFGHIILLDLKNKPPLNTLWFLVLWSRYFGCKILIPHLNRKNTGLIERYNSRGVGLQYLNWFISNSHFVEHYNHREKDKLRVEFIHPSTYNLLLNIEGVYTSDSHSLTDIYQDGTVIDHSGRVVSDVQKSNQFYAFFNSSSRHKKKGLLEIIFNLILSVRRVIRYVLNGRL
jgi:hypothetical protein